MGTPGIAALGSFTLPTQVLPAHNKQPRFITHVQINEENKLVAAAAWFNYLILYLLVQ